MDTRSKRASSVGILLGFVILAPVLPDGTLSGGDRQHIAYGYSGISPASSAEGAGASAGVAVVSGVGASEAEAVGASAGTSTVTGVSTGSIIPGAGDAAGSATVSGIGASDIAGVGSSAGIATVSGVGADASVPTIYPESIHVVTLTVSGPSVVNMEST